MDYPKDFDRSLSDFSRQGLGPISQSALEALAAKGYKLKLGMTLEATAAIRELAQEASIREYCPRDLEDRFSDEAATKRWLEKGRAVFLLVGENDAVAGYGWVGAGSSEFVPGGQTTFAVRLGEGSQGKGLASHFTRLIISGAAARYGSSKIWLETWESNGGAVHIYRKLGAVEVAQETGKRKRPDGSAVEDVRLYMTLSDELLNP